jgi:hypothetical protein
MHGLPKELNLSRISATSPHGFLPRASALEPVAG